jgi:CubicO group peptidase (beta-lactamase class C family)
MDAGDISGQHLDFQDLDGDTANLEPARLFDNDTLFQAASISKAITALAVIKLCQEVKLDLDALLSQYLLNLEQISWISTLKTQALVFQISFRLLLSHTSSLRVHGFGGYSKTDIPTLPRILRGDPPANNEQISLFTLLGLGFAYSGGGFTVLQLILETHLQKPLYQSMDETVLQPLKMSRSTV